MKYEVLERWTTDYGWRHRLVVTDAGALVVLYHRRDLGEWRWLDCPCVDDCLPLFAPKRTRRPAASTMKRQGSLR